MKSICVFAGSAQGTKASYSKSAIDLGQEIAKRSYQRKLLLYWSKFLLANNLYPLENGATSRGASANGAASRHQPWRGAVAGAGAGG